MWCHIEFLINTEEREEREGDKRKRWWFREATTS